MFLRVVPYVFYALSAVWFGGAVAHPRQFVVGVLGGLLCWRLGAVLSCVGPNGETGEDGRG